MTAGLVATSDCFQRFYYDLASDRESFESLVCVCSASLLQCCYENGEPKLQPGREVTKEQPSKPTLESEREKPEMTRSSESDYLETRVVARNV